MRSKFLILIGVMALMVAACGGGDDGVGADTTAPPVDEGGGADTTAPPDDDSGSDPTTGPETPDSTAPAGGGAVNHEISELGSFTVNGILLAVSFSIRCIPSGDGADNISLQGVAQGESGGTLDLRKGSNFVEVTVDGSNFEEMFGSRAFVSAFGTESDVSEVSGDRWTGSATLFDQLEVADPVEVTWDMMIPDETTDC